MSGALGRQLSYQWQRHILRRRHMLASGLPHGMEFRFRTADDVGRRIYKRGVHEPHVLALLESRVAGAEASVVFDVGANLGWYAVLMERLSGGQAEIYAFEPDPENCALLAGNLVLNRTSHVEVVDCALSDHEGQGSLHRYRDINLGRHSLVRMSRSTGALPVRLQTLDGFAADRGLDGRPVQLLKVDVEGHEPEVLEGARTVLGATRLLVLEYSPMYYRPGAAAAMIALLERSGLRPSLFDGSTWRPASRAELLSLDRQCDTAWTR